MHKLYSILILLSCINFILIGTIGMKQDTNLVKTEGTVEHILFSNGNEESARYHIKYTVDDKDYTLVATCNCELMDSYEKIYVLYNPQAPSVAKLESDHSNLFLISVGVAAFIIFSYLFFVSSQFLANMPLKYVLAVLPFPMLIASLYGLFITILSLDFKFDLIIKSEATISFIVFLILSLICLVIGTKALNKYKVDTKE